MMGFYVVKNGVPAHFIVEDSAFEGVKSIAAVVADDISLTVPDGKRPEIKTGAAGCDTAILMATDGRSDMLSELEKSGKIDLSQIRGRREVFMIQGIETPLADGSVKELLVIAGSDKRGTVYGMFRLSELCGVSPLVYFGDAVPEKHKDICIDSTYVSKEPSVRYRGFFINDEWPAFGCWASEKFGGINAKAYEKIFQLLLRLKGNYFWPAMWNSSFSEDGPGLGNAELADKYGVIMGASHHEPMCRAGVEWQRKYREYGDDNSWSFISNSDAITRFWEDGILRNKPFENVITIGMRGENDSKLLPEDAKLKDNVDIVKKAILTQNELIKKHIGDVPRMLAIYKEVEDYYYGDETCEGLKDWSELDDVIFLLSDDNYGNLRALPTKEEAASHRGGYGMYYHFDYHGGPISYEWVNTNRLTKTWEQMSQAYDSGVREMWIVNVGDLKGNEYPLSYFMALAYDFEGMGTSAPNMTESFLRRWIDTQFGSRLTDEQKKDMYDVIYGYTKWNYIRTPEAMGEDIFTTAFGECERVAEETGRLLETAERLERTLTGEALDTYHSMVYYHASASLSLVQMYAYAVMNKELAKRGCVYANKYAGLVRERIAADAEYVSAFHSTLGGKWAHCMDSAHTGFKVWDDNDWTYPTVAEVIPIPFAKHVAGFRGSIEYHLGTHWGDSIVLVSDGFTRPDTDEVLFDLDSRGNISYSYEMKYDCPWLICEEKTGRVEIADGGHRTIRFTVDRTKITGDVSADVTVDIVFDNGRKDLSRLRFTAGKAPSCTDENVFLERQGYVCILAEHFSEKKDTDGGFMVIDHLGREHAAVKAFPNMKSWSGSDAPYLRYSFITEKGGTYNAVLYLLSRNPVIKGAGMYFGISVNGGDHRRVNAVSDTFYTEHFCAEWANGVLDKVRPVTVSLELKEGRNDVYFYAGDTGIILEKLVFFPADRPLPKSYLGPCESCRLK
ncbi:MAG: glycosyl hydrolase 115 family protein [Oscillospiraceae bacterium]|nr:glycosyl hydrolase 115 family protein [Oscillospiraceae bacterium]